MAYNIGSVVSHAFTFDNFIFTYLLPATVTAADVGKAVTFDTTVASGMKLTADNDAIFGRLETFEDRSVLGIKVGAVARKLKCKLPAAVGHAIVLGNEVCGSAVAGQVKPTTAQPTAALRRNTVVEVGVDFVVVEYL